LLFCTISSVYPFLLLSNVNRIAKMYSIKQKMSPHNTICSLLKLIYVLIIEIKITVNIRIIFNIFISQKFSNPLEPCTRTICLSLVIPRKIDKVKHFMYRFLPVICLNYVRSTWILEQKSLMSHSLRRFIAFIIQYI